MSLMSLSSPSVAEPSDAKKAALALAYGVMSDQHCGTHDAAAVMELLFADKLPRPSDATGKEAIVTVAKQYFAAGEQRFCVAVKSFLRSVVGRNVD